VKLKLPLFQLYFFWWVNQEKRILQRHVKPGFRNVFYKREFKEFKIYEKQYKVEYQIQKPKFGTVQLHYFAMNVGEKKF